MENTVERTFYSDASHNYMVIECPRELRDNYQYKMLAANQIKGLLACSSRCIDNQDYLYYDITSRQSLKDIYDRRPIRGADIEKLLEDLLRVEKTLTEYLLDASHMLLDPSCIYQDFRGNACSFVYYPGEAGQAGWETLFAFLADRVDGKDKHGAALAYRLCMLAEKPGFRLNEEIMDELGLATGKSGKGAEAGKRMERMDAAGFSAVERQGAGRNRGGGQGLLPEDDRRSRRLQEGRKYVPAYQPRDAFSGSGRFRNEGRKERDFYPLGLEEAEAGPVSPDLRAGQADKWREGKEAGEREENVSGQKEGTSLLKTVLPYLGLGLLAAAGAGLLMLNRVMILEETELILSRAAGGVLIAAGVLASIFSLVRFRKERGGKGKAGAEEGDYADSPYADREDRLEALLYGEGGERGLWNAPARSADRYEEAGGRRDRDRSAYSMAIPGETSLLGPDTEKPLALYGTGSCRGEQISLASLPCVVGKVREYVDQVLDDASVSRMHARFSLDREGKMTVRDLNSTNGTWLNGDRLMPNESRTLRQGDHVRLGGMEFVYR